MSYLRNFFAEQQSQKDDSYEVIEMFINRLEGVTSIEDKRDALKALRFMAKTHRLTVSTLGLNYYMELLSNQVDVKEIVDLVLEILTACLTSEDGEIERDDLGHQLAVMVINQPPFFGALFRILEMVDFQARRHAVQLLTTLARHCLKEVQEAVLSHPLSISKIVELLVETHEVIRNDTVLLLTLLSQDNEALQNLLAYESTIEQLFDIISQETADSIVVEDCLFVILNMLKQNQRNQEYFREAKLLQRITELAFLFLCPSDATERSISEWPEKKTSNFVFILEIFRSLVPSPEITGFEAQRNHAAHKIIIKNKMTELLTMLTNNFGVGIDLLSESIVTVTEIFAGNYSSQELWSHTNFDEVNRGTLLLLIKTMASDEDKFHLLSSMFYTYTSFIFYNLTRKTDESRQLDAGYAAYEELSSKLIAATEEVEKVKNENSQLRLQLEVRDDNFHYFSGTNGDAYLAQLQTEYQNLINLAAEKRAKIEKYKAMLKAHDKSAHDNKIRSV